MKKSLLLFCFLAVSGSASFAAERTVLARVTGYWPMGASNARGCGTGAILRNGHCAVDPKAIPYRSKVIFPDAVCEAVDSGPAVVSRKSARCCGRTKAEREALVIDRFFESKAEAVRWSNTHPQFMKVRVIGPGDELPASLASMTKPATAAPPATTALATTKTGAASAAKRQTIALPETSVGSAPIVASVVAMTPSGTALPRPQRRRG